MFIKKIMNISDKKIILKNGCIHGEIFAAMIKGEYYFLLWRISFDGLLSTEIRYRSTTQKDVQ